MLAIEAVLTALGPLVESVKEMVRLEDVSILHILGAHQEHADICLTHLCRFYALVFMVENAEPAKFISSIHEHEEDLKDEALVLVPPTHLDHE